MLQSSTKIRRVFPVPLNPFFKTSVSGFAWNRNRERGARSAEVNVCARVSDLLFAAESRTRKKESSILEAVAKVAISQRLGVKEL